MRKLFNSPMLMVYLLWIVEFTLLMIIASAVCLIAVAAIGQVSVWEVIKSVVHLINV